MKKITVDGNEACSYASYHYTEVAGIYPITPSSPMAEHIDEWSQQGKKNIFGSTAQVIEMQSEGGAAGLVHGSLVSGCLTSTYTASQGLLLMIPNFYKWAGERLPGVVHVAARSLSTHALSILGDHQDIYAARSTGVCMIASSNVQDAHDFSIVAHLASIECSLPFIHFFDGFRTSHEIQKINVLEEDEYAALMDMKAVQRFRDHSMNPKHPNTRGTAQNDDIYFQAMEAKNSVYDEAVETIVSVMNRVSEKTGRTIEPFTYYGDLNATDIIVAMGSVNETIKETIDDLNNQGYQVGLIEVHLYRPFSKTYFEKVLPKTVKRIAVLDRTKEPGSVGEPLYLDVKSIVPETISVYGGRYGLSSKNTTPRDIKAVYDFLQNHPHHSFTIGIKDDVTHLSLPSDSSYKPKLDTHELLLYGYGSDGMVSAGKSLISMIGDQTDHFVQGYFQYDSKKSGGVTIGHLRFSKNPIRSTYYVENPSMIVITKDQYIKEFDVFSKIQENGIFLMNTIDHEEEINRKMPTKMKQLIHQKHCQVYGINAYEIAYRAGLKNKISMIMEASILSLMNLLDKDEWMTSLERMIQKKFSKKGEEVVQANIHAVQMTLDKLQKITIDQEPTFDLPEDDSVIGMMMNRKGDELPTSAFLHQNDGVFPSGTSVIEKRKVTETVPSWISSNCINCHQCSLVCPHGVIRPFLLTEEEYQKAPIEVQNRATKPFGRGLENYYYILSISIEDCTGCGLCMSICPGFKLQKALVPKSLKEESQKKEQEIYNYLSKNISFKEELQGQLFTVKNSQFKEPKFQFSGACAGCGETAYLKLLTQLFGDSMMIANATGCSSIYGASVPSTPYRVPWASSLFEDNAEYGFGMYQAVTTIRHRIKEIMENQSNHPQKHWFTQYMENMNDYQKTEEVYKQVDDTWPQEIIELKEYIPYRSIWMVGGDGWAYDIGFGGIDHVLSTNENVNILVLDSQVYSNTGGQASKASPKGSIASFASTGKTTYKKDLARIAMCYPNAYVATVNLGANQAQVIKAMKEAEEHQGPSIIIAYCSCIAHGIQGGMENSLKAEAMATKCGYFPIFRYVPEEEKFYLDSKNVNFDLYEEFLETQNRYRMLKVVNKEHANELLESNKQEAIKRYQYYQSLGEE